MIHTQERKYAIERVVVDFISRSLQPPGLTTRHTGRGHQVDFEVLDGTGAVCGYGEIGEDASEEIEAMTAYLAKHGGESLALPQDSGHWMVEYAPHTQLRTADPSLPTIVAMANARGITELSCEAGQRDQELRGLCHGSGIRSLRKLAAAPDEAYRYLSIAGDGNLNSDIDHISTWMQARLACTDMKGNAEKLHDKPGQRHLALLVGTATDTTVHGRLSGLFPMRGTPRALAIPDPLTDVWLIAAGQLGVWWNASGRVRVNTYTERRELAQ